MTELNAAENMDVVIQKIQDLQDFLMLNFSNWDYANDIASQLDDFAEHILYLKNRTVYTDEDGREYTTMDAHPNERIYINEEEGS